MRCFFKIVHSILGRFRTKNFLYISISNLLTNITKLFFKYILPHDLLMKMLFVLLNAITLTWNNIFHIDLYAICSKEILKHIYINLSQFSHFLPCLWSFHASVGIEPLMSFSYIPEQWFLTH